MKTKYLLVVIFLCILIFSAGIVIADSGIFSSGTTNEVNVTNDNKTLVVGFDSEFPPFGYEDDHGEYVGFDLEMAQEVCDRNGWNLVKKPIVWSDKDAYLDSGEIDCIWNGFTMEGREDSYTWSKPYMSNKQIFIVKSNSGINSTSDLSGKIVETQEGSSAVEILENDHVNLTMNFKRLIQIVDFKLALNDLDKNSCDAVTIDYTVAEYMANRRGSDNYIILSENISSENYGVGFKKGNTDLRDKVQETLDEMFADGTVEKIANNYKEYGIPDLLNK